MEKWGTIPGERNGDKMEAEHNGLYPSLDDWAGPACYIDIFNIQLFRHLNT